MRRGIKVLDSDAHVIEPGGLFAPWSVPGAAMIDLPPGTPMVPCGDMDLLADQFSHGFDASSYLRAMDRQGIDGVVLYPSVGLFAPFQPELDAPASARACAAYNDWIAAFCAGDPARLAGVGLLPVADVGLAAQEALRCADLGLVAVMVRPNRLHGANLGEPHFDPLFRAVAGAGLVLSVHEGLGVRGPTTGADRFSTFVERHACSHPMEQMAAMLSLVMGGALERHPTLRVAFLESGTGWLPYWLHRLDEHAEWLRDTECRDLSLAPSEYFRRQCAISADPEDDLAPSVIEAVGGGHVLWASDFPHPDAIFPGAVDATLAAWLDRAGLAPETAQQVLWDTPLSFYRLDGRFG